MQFVRACLAGMFITFFVCVFVCVCVCASFPFGFEGAMWDSIDHCPSSNLQCKRSSRFSAKIMSTHSFMGIRRLNESLILVLIKAYALSDSATLLVPISPLVPLKPRLLTLVIR